MRALLPGSFDAPTQGHLDVARRAAGMFDEVVMCILTNPTKTGRLPLTERLALLADMISDLTMLRRTPVTPDCWSTTATERVSA